MKLLQICLVFVVTLPLPFLAFSEEAAKPASAEASLLAEVTATYRNAGLVQMPVEKRITYEWKPKQDVSSGKMYYSKGKVRWELDKPEKTWTIFDGKTWWNVEFASEDFPGGKNKVTQASVNKKNRDQFFVLDLLAAKDPSQQFSITQKSEAGGELILTLKPKKKAEFSEIEVTVNKEKKTFSEISFKDDIGNLTKIKLGTPEIQDKSDSQLFKYVPDAKKDQVSKI